MKRRLWLTSLAAALVAVSASSVLAAATLNRAGASFPCPLYV